MAVLKNFCIFLSLSNGAIIIGVINLLYGLLQTLAEVLLFERNMRPFSHADRYTKAINTVRQDLEKICWKEMIIYLLGIRLIRVYKHVQRPLWSIFITGYCFTVGVLYTENSLCSMQLLFGIYLLWGTIKEKPSFLYANVILHLAFIAHSATFTMFAIFNLLAEQSLPNGEQIISETLKIPILMYFASIIYSRHEELVVKSPILMQPVDRRNPTESDEEIDLDS